MAYISPVQQLQSQARHAALRWNFSSFRFDCIFPFGLLVSLAAGDADELLDATGVPQGLGVLHVLGDDLVQCAADCCDGVVRHGLPHQAAGVACTSSRSAAVVVVAASGQTVHQVPHGIFTCHGGKSDRRVWEIKETGRKYAFLWCKLKLGLNIFCVGFMINHLSLY